MSFTPLLILKELPDIPVSTLEEEQGSRPHPGEPRFRLLARDEGSFPCFLGKEFPAFPSHLKRSRPPQERREELQRRAIIPKSTRYLSPFKRNVISLHCLDFHGEDQLPPRRHMGQP